MIGTDTKGMLTSILLACFSLIVITGLAWAGPGDGQPRITADELITLIRDGERVTLIDVRTPEEFEGGHIPGAVLIPLAEIVHADELPYDGKIVLYCRSGMRSAKARGVLAGRGITGLVDLEGGIKAWIAAGGNVIAGPAVEGKTYPPSFIAPEESCETSGGAADADSSPTTEADTE